MKKHKEKKKDSILDNAQEEESKQISVSSKEWDAVNEKLKEAEDRILRISADFENSKKRLTSRAEETVKFANEKIILDIFPVVDDLDRAVSSLDQGHDTKSIQEGLHMVQKTFHKILEQSGVKPIESLNQMFDPNLHEAVGEVESDEEEGEVVDEVQRGYLLNGRLIRPSRVRISKKSS